MQSRLTQEYLKVDGNFVASQEPGFVVMKIIHIIVFFSALAEVCVCVCVPVVQGAVRELKAGRDVGHFKLILVKCRGWKCWRFRNIPGKRCSSQCPSTLGEALDLISQHLPSPVDLTGSLWNNGH